MRKYDQYLFSTNIPISINTLDLSKSANRWNQKFASIYELWIKLQEITRKNNYSDKYQS